MEINRLAVLALNKLMPTQIQLPSFNLPLLKPLSQRFPLAGVGRRSCTPFLLKLPVRIWAAWEHWREGVMVAHPLDEWKDEIREETLCLGMEVVIVPSEEWDPPSIRSVSESDLASVFPHVVAQIQRAMSRIGLPSMSNKQLKQEVSYVGSPSIRKISYVAKVRFLAFRLAGGSCILWAGRITLQEAVRAFGAREQQRTCSWSWLGS